MKKNFLTGLATGLFLFGIVAMASANIVTTDTGHIYNTADGGIIDDWYFHVGTTGPVTIKVNYLSGFDFDSWIWLLSDRFPDLSSESVIGYNDDDHGSYESLLTLRLPTGDYHLRVSESYFNNAFMIYEDDVNGDWYYNVAIQGGDVSFNNIAPVPEPATMLLLGAGLVGLIWAKVKK